MKKIYLAGPDVFYPDAVAHGRALQVLCAQHGFEGLFPLDQQAPAGLSGEPLARWIYEANVALIRQADLVMANVNDFRGNEPDSGTCFEIGYAVALSKPVYLYMHPAGSIRDQVTARVDADGVAWDAQGCTVEDFGLPRNLMLAIPGTLVFGDAAACLVEVAGQEK